eukprot:4540300-Pleurochrysis_carterae.AAC.1
MFGPLASVLERSRHRAQSPTPSWCRCLPVQGSAFMDGHYPPNFFGLAQPSLIDEILFSVGMLLLGAGGPGVIIGAAHELRMRRAAHVPLEQAQTRHRDEAWTNSWDGSREGAGTGQVQARRWTASAMP